MKLSLRVICDCGIIETVKQRVHALTNYLNLSDDYTFLPYWKDEECVVLGQHRTNATIRIIQ